MKNVAKYFVLSVAIIGQIVGIIFLFINIEVALTFYAIYMVTILLLFWLLIRERKKEKKEDEENDYRDY
ncbi:hypothetical protein [Fredinandcohnia sp. 179-A 10B2 NHS]|uniref:hypothetical protein n=1 Tax=Fredinandcohnia sp. 179-A 10B2 NHS TaxID=3235176 RepID=UPI0039A39E36